MSDTHAHTVRYVRETMLPEQDPPITEKGAVKWMRENLFSSWLNAILTVVSLVFIVYVLSGLLPWALGGVWDAGSLTECRTVLSAFGVTGHDGACWAVIEDRWLQLMFGFYPPEQYWRPLVAFLLLLVALAPVLFSDWVPSRLLIFTALYPFLAVWLIWGGSFWMPILVIVGFIVGYAVFAALSRVTIGGIAVAGAIVAAALWWMVGLDVVSQTMDRMVGGPRYESALADARAASEALPAEVTALEEQRDGIEESIDILVDERDQLADELIATIQAVGAGDILLNELVSVQGNVTDTIEAVRAGGGQGEFDTMWEALRSFRDTQILLRDKIGALLALDGALEIGVVWDEVLSRQDALDDTFEALDAEDVLNDLDVAQDQLLTLQDILVAMSDPLEGTVEAIRAGDVWLNRTALQDQLLAMQDDLAALRDDLRRANRAVTVASDQLSTAQRSVTALEALPDLEASIPDLEQAVEDARAAVPQAIRGYGDVQDLPEGTPEEDAALLTAYLDAQFDLNTARTTVANTYSRLALTGLSPVESNEIGGFMLAVLIGLSGIVLSLPIGILLALGRQSDLFIINKCSVTFIEVIRGVPLIVWLFTASLLLNYFLPPGTNFDLMLRVIIMVTLFASAYIAEVVRGGLAALPRGQYEGADSLGLDYWQSMRLIILPQALKISIPGIVSTFIGLFKDTTLVVFIGLLDPIGLSNAIRADTAWNGIYWELFIFIGLCFFIFCFSMSRYSQWLERKLNTGHR